MKKDLELVNLCSEVGNIALGSGWYTQELADELEMKHPGVDFKDLTLGQILEADKQFPRGLKAHEQ